MFASCYFSHAANMGISRTLMLYRQKGNSKNFQYVNHITSHIVGLRGLQTWEPLSWCFYVVYSISTHT